MPLLDQVNVPSVIDADIEVDVSGDNDFSVASDIKGDMTALETTGGDYPVEQIATWAGPLAALGLQNLSVWTLTCVYSDGETTDTWKVLRDAQGDDAAIRYAPAGDTSGNRMHTLVGRIAQVSDPTPAGNQSSWQYTAVFIGATSYSAISA